MWGLIRLSVIPGDTRRQILTFDGKRFECKSQEAAALAADLFENRMLRYFPFGSISFHPVRFH